MNRARPLVVTIIAALIFLEAAAQAVVGILLLIAQASGVDSEWHGRVSITVAAALLILSGLIYVLVGLGLLRGSDLARVLVTLNSLLSFAAGLYLGLTGFVPGFVTAAVTLLIIVLLWFGPGASYFPRRTR